MKKLAKLAQLLSFIFAFWLCIEPVQVFAALPDENIVDMFNKNGIYYYNPAGSSDYCNTSSTKLAGDNITEKIWNYFINQGFSDAQVAGIIGNGMAESGLQLTRASNNSYWGLFQWGGGRKDRLFAKIREANLGKYLTAEYWPSGAQDSIPSSDLDKLLQIELDFTISEKDLDWQNEIKKASTPEMAAEIFLVLFERAVNGDSEILYYAPYAGRLYQGTSKRRDFAKETYQKYAGHGVSYSGSVSGGAEDGSNVSIIGDSITVGSQNAILNKFPELTTNDIDAAVGRLWEEGITIAKNSHNSLKKYVVFALGTNNPNGLSTAKINSAIKAIGDDHIIVFVTNYGSADYTTNNDLLKQYATENSNIIIADWNSTVSSNPFLYLNDDKIHPNEAGTRLFAENIYDAINGNTNEVGCSVNGEFQALVQSYAWPDWHPAPWHDRMPAYATAVTQSISEGRYVGGSVAGVPGIDCGGFVTILVQNSGLAPDYNDTKGNTTTQEKWVKNHNWHLINSSPNSKVDTSLLQPGDVAFSSGHTFIYVGDIPGFNSVIASASYSTNNAGRAPMAGKEDLTFGNGAIVRWYRNPNFSPYQNTGSISNLANGHISNAAPFGSVLLEDHHVSFYKSSTGKNADNAYNNGYLSPGQAASNYLPLGTVVYVQTQATGETSYAHGKYFLITDRGAGKIDGDYNLDIFHDAEDSSENNYLPYGSSSNAKIYKVAENVSWETFKAKYGW